MSNRTRPLDLDWTPEQLAAAWPMETGFVLLESTLPNDKSWSVLTAFPSDIITNDLPDWSPQNRTDSNTTEDSCRASRTVAPFTTGWIGYLAYESAPLWNNALTTRAPHPHHPVAWWGRYNASLAYSHADGAWQLNHCEESVSAADRLMEMVDQLVDTLERTPSTTTAATATELRLGIEETHYESSIDTILDWIRQGHIYQANFTYPISATLQDSPFDLYQRLRCSNPAPYGAFLQSSPNMAILSSSPEQFLRIENGRIQTQPIKGTEARHENEQIDRGLAQSLLESEKDRAELTMIVDLERNDLGRICQYGSVVTHPFPELQSFSAVHHLVATVEGQLREDVSLKEILAATFPGGSITGAPKIRAMEIIASLETRPRFIYTGALGYLDDRGVAELALTIRTLWTEGDQVHLDVGGGIVIDSTAESEWEETHQKAEGMRRAIEGHPAPASSITPS